MKICIPVNEDRGLASTVCEHFGSAPLFMVVETDSGEAQVVLNKNQQHRQGGCMPLQSLQGHAIDAVVVGGIGGGALNKLTAAGIKVFVSDKGLVSELVEGFTAGTLEVMQPGMACRQHRGRSGQGCHSR